MDETTNISTDGVSSESTTTLNEVDVDEQGVKETAEVSRPTSDYVPYSRFKEVNEKYRQTERQLYETLGALQAMQMLPQQQAPMQPQFNAEEFWQLAEQDPLSWMQLLYEGFREKHEYEQTQRQQEQRYVTGVVSSAQSRVFEAFPALNNDHGKALVERFALALDSTLPETYSVEDCYMMAAEEASKIIQALGGKAAARQQARQQAFVEGEGNLLPELTDEQAEEQAYQKALKAGDVDALMAMKLRRLNSKKV